MGQDTGTVTCAVCGNTFGEGETRRVCDATPGTQAALKSQMPEIGPDQSVCLPDIARMRRVYLERLLEKERGELTALDEQVLESLETGTLVADEPDATWEDARGLGERAADAVARFGGSWTFILTFCVILAVWMAVNATGFLLRTFDPYPFILLNLVLSCIAALQAPIIMMSQRRQEAKDRLRSENDYKVNLKAELEIRHLHEKIDLHLHRQWERLASIQRLQIELLEEAARGDMPRK
ncbi:DUF1003 domain-containing protein [Hyphomonas sp. WL0036]|uniref:DUF1003 domain-containing protein n=1 Tax=Hyphomonas sediminis TaxID=2866160 RepID=UPI001C80700A|nr:DUF1003 domain-containing protein [Hyphomonas sediminis]MBY9067134.1 DUF1003 domain-containing protein [Hyphomonas sediminis]